MNAKGKPEYVLKRAEGNYWSPRKTKQDSTLLGIFFYVIIFVIKFFSL